MARRRSPPAISAGQRALWTFLGATLLGPCIAALAAALLTWLGLTVAPERLAMHGAQTGVQRAAEMAMTTFVWSAFPAALAGAASAAWLILNGTLPWLVMAAAAAIAATLALVLIGGLSTVSTTLAAFIAAGSGVLVWHALSRAGILPPAD